MRHSGEAAVQSNAFLWQGGEADLELSALCRRIRTADALEARALPAQVLSYMATTLSRVEIELYVEECLPMVCEATHAYVRSMGAFSVRYADSDGVEATRERLIQSLEILADEVRLCRPLPVNVSPQDMHLFGASAPTPSHRR